MFTLTALGTSLRRAAPQLLSIARRWNARRELNRTRRALMTLDDAMLRDVGVSRWDLRPGSPNLAKLIVRDQPARKQVRSTTAVTDSLACDDDVCLCP